MGSNPIGASEMSNFLVLITFENYGNHQMDDIPTNSQNSDVKRNEGQ